MFGLTPELALWTRARIVFYPINFNITMDGFFYTITIDVIFIIIRIKIKKKIVSKDFNIGKKFGKTFKEKKKSCDIGIKHVKNLGSRVD